MKKIIAINIICILLCMFVQNQKELPVMASLPLEKIEVVIDAGHGGLDNGAISGGKNEDDLNLKIAMQLKTSLESQGAIVYLTRDGDYDMTKRDYLYSKQDDMYLRVKEIDQYEADFLISIHLNASVSTSVWGSQVFYYNHSAEGKILANSIHQKMLSVTGSRKSISGSNFKVLKDTQTLGVLIECGFITNPNERGQLSSSSYHQKLAQTITEGLIEYIH